MTEGMHFDILSRSDAANLAVPSRTALPLETMPSATGSQYMVRSLVLGRRAGSFVRHLDAQAIKGAGPEQTICVVIFGVDILEAWI